MEATHHKGHKRSAHEVVEQRPERVRIVEIPEAVPADYPRDTPRVHPRRPGYEDDLEMAAVNRTRNARSLWARSTHQKRAPWHARLNNEREPPYYPGAGPSLVDILAQDMFRPPMVKESIQQRTPNVK